MVNGFGQAQAQIILSRLINTGQAQARIHQPHQLHYLIVDDRVILLVEEDDTENLDIELNDVIRIDLQLLDIERMSLNINDINY